MTVLAETKSIRVLLVEDHEVVRTGLRVLMEKEPAFEILDDVGDGESALEAARSQHPDVMLMDISMPKMNGIEATRRITSEMENIKILCLSMHREKRMIGAMLKAGASGYLVKSCAAKELNAAIQVVASGEIYISPSIAGDVVDEYVRGSPERKKSLHIALSSRERQVLQMIAEEHNTKEIAARMTLSEKTVAAHRLKLMDKLNIHTVAGLTHYAIREGLCDL
jgi:DNA-binding NarL/FixJ family response regulator